MEAPTRAGVLRQVAANQPRPSITSHRLFPAVVALWFATLLGLGFAVLPASALEKLVGASGIAAYIPAAAPPLGLTARIVLSLGAGIAGGLIGYAIARALAPHRERKEREPQVKERPAQRRRAVAEGMRRPLSAMEDLGPPMIAPGPKPDESGELFEDVATGHRPMLALQEDEPELSLEAEPAQAEEPEAADDAAFDTFAEAELANEPEPEPEPEQEFVGPLLQAPPVPRALPSDPTADLSGMGVVQLAERLGHAMRRSAGRPKSPPPALLAELIGRPVEPRHPAPPVAEEPSLEPAPEVTSAPSVPFADPGVPEARRGPELPQPLAAAERILARASVASAGDAATEPDAPRPLAPALEAFGEEEYDYEESYLSSLSLPHAGLSPIDGPIEDDAIEDEEEWDSGEEDELYSSLLAMRQPEREPAPEMEEFPAESAPTGEVRPFDAPQEAAAPQHRPNRAETERVLRSALEAIQRMSGAA